MNTVNLSSKVFFVDTMGYHLNYTNVKEIKHSIRSALKSKMA